MFFMFKIKATERAIQSSYIFFKLVEKQLSKQPFMNVSCRMYNEKYSFAVQYSSWEDGLMEKQFWWLSSSYL